MRQSVKKGTESNIRRWAWVPYLVKVCAGFWGYTFDDPHILNENLTSSFDHGGIGALLPTRAEDRVDQTFSPRRIKTRGFRIHTRYLSTG